MKNQLTDHWQFAISQSAHAVLSRRVAHVRSPDHRRQILASRGDNILVALGDIFSEKCLIFLLACGPDERLAGSFDQARRRLQVSLAESSDNATFWPVRFVAGKIGLERLQLEIISGNRGFE